MMTRKTFDSAGTPEMKKYALNKYTIGLLPTFVENLNGKYVGILQHIMLL